MKKKISPFGFAFVFPLAAALLLGIGCSDDDENGINGFNGNNGNKSITVIVRDNDNLTTLETALDSANLDSTLDTAGPFTVFAPIDGAFEQLDSAELAQLLTDSAGTLRRLLRYHVVSGELSSVQLAARDSVIALSGGTIYISVRNGELFLNDSVKVTTADIKASNGTVHVIDKVLVP